MSFDENADQTSRGRHSQVARVAAIGLMAATAGLFVWVAFGSDSDEGLAAASPDTNPDGAGIESEPPSDLGPVPELVDISDWLNTDADSFDEVRGDVTIVQFWTFGCSNCKATLPHLQDLYADRREDGLEIIGVHAHEFDHERDPRNVSEAVSELGVTWPVALDTNKTNFVEWQGSPRYWPRTYVIDGENRIRFDHIGEGHYDQLAATVDYLLNENV